VALTHRSFGEGENNETLEFLGDAVLALAMSDLLMARFPEAREGDLSKMRASLVNAEVLARKARELDLGRWLRLGKGEEKSGGRDKPSILAATYEALLGAVYLDGGYERARAVVEAHFTADVLEHLTVGLRDYKTELQELTQRLFRETPAYTLVEESGPDHEKRFVSEIAIGGQWFGRGVGRSKKTAEQAAAMQALAALARQYSENVR
jgi:ribonuclease III